MTNSKRVVFTMGGKGGVGKTGVMVALAEWFEANEIPVTLLDLDTENKARGSLKHFFNGSVTKVNIHTPAGLDAFVDHLDSGSEIILADMGAGAGQVAADWFESMYEDVAATGVSFTDYVVVENATSTLSDFTYWRSTDQAKKFREAFAPTVLQMEFRLAELENPVRQHGIKLGDVADRKSSVSELKRASLIMRAQSYRRRLFSEFDRTKEVFLP
jgi:hypothetical protein